MSSAKTAVKSHSQRRTRFSVALLLLILIISTNSVSLADTTDFNRFTRFGYPFYAPISTPSQFDIGDIVPYSSKYRSILNLNSSVDLLYPDSRFHHVNLAGTGQSAEVGALGVGLDGTRILLNSRPFRNPGDNRGHLELLPLHSIGSLRSALYGLIDGYMGFSGVVEVNGINPANNDPVSLVSYRKGYYEAEPVEFVHSRRLGLNTYGVVGAYFQTANGRLEHSLAGGESMYTSIRHNLTPQQSLTVDWMGVRNSAQLPFSDLTRSTRRSDLDLRWEVQPDSLSNYRVGIYRAETGIEESDGAEWGREWGVTSHLQFNRLALMVRGAIIDGRLFKADETYSLSELEALGGGQLELGWLDLSAWGGLTGWLPERVKAIGFLSAEGNFTQDFAVYLRAKHTANAHSAEMLYADYQPSVWLRNHYEPVWWDNPELPIVGGELPVTTLYGGTIGVRLDSRFGKIDISGYQEWDENLPVWAVIGDTIVTPRSLKKRSRLGWSGRYEKDIGDFNVAASAVGYSQEYEGFPSGANVLVDPLFRAFSIVSWQRQFIGGQLETNIALSAMYAGTYQVLTKAGQTTQSGGLPIDLRATVRIKTFTLYYGLHNMFGSSYQYIPGYKMMHKEEYWGADWTLFL